MIIEKSERKKSEERTNNISVDFYFGKILMAMAVKPLDAANAVWCYRNKQQ